MRVLAFLGDGSEREKVACDDTCVLNKLTYMAVLTENHKLILESPIMERVKGGKILAKNGCQYIIGFIVCTCQIVPD